MKKNDNPMLFFFFPNWSIDSFSYPTSTRARLSEDQDLELSTGIYIYIVSERNHMNMF